MCAVCLVQYLGLPQACQRKNFIIKDIIKSKRPVVRELRVELKKVQVFRDKKTLYLVNSYRHSRVACCLCLHSAGRTAFRTELAHTSSSG